MNAPRERRRPGATSPFPLVPNVEAIIPAAAETPDAPISAVPTGARGDAPEAQPAHSARGSHVDKPDAKVARTFQLRSGTLGAAQTAVLRTAGLEGGYLSLNALVEAAITRELQRLAGQFNGGEAFPSHVGKFRTGRPINS